jgi:ankyrin repeat protein
MSSSATPTDLQLLAAAKDNSACLVRAALADGANINAVDEFGRCALYIAARRGCTEALEVLVNAAAQVDIVAKNGWCALSCAVEKGRRRIVEILLKATTEPLTKSHGSSSPWYLALKQGNPDIVSVFIQAGVDINDSVGSFETNFPLTVAARFNHTAIISMLVEHGAEVNAFNANRAPVLTTAACERNVPMVSFLLDLGADPRLKDGGGLTAIDRCVLHGGYVPVLRRLLAAGACIPPGQPCYNRSGGVWYDEGHGHAIVTLLASGVSVYELE